eukprot:70169_1
MADSDEKQLSDSSTRQKLCTFFQQSGGCTKDDCRFTHVKARDEFKDMAARLFFRNIPEDLTVNIIASCIGREFDGEFFVFKNYSKHVAHVVFKTWDMAQPLIDQGFLDLPASTGKLTYMVNVPNCGYHEWDPQGPFSQHQLSAHEREFRILKDSFRAEKGRLVELHACAISDLQSKNRAALRRTRGKHASEIGCLTTKLEKQSERGIREMRRSLITEHVIARASIRSKLKEVQKDNTVFADLNVRLQSDCESLKSEMESLRKELEITVVSPPAQPPGPSKDLSGTD